MTKLLEKALSRLAKLSDSAQDEIAQIIINEIESEKKWDVKWAKSQSLLKKMATAALTEHRPDPSIEQAWVAESKRRLAAMRSGRMRTYSLAQVFSK